MDLQSAFYVVAMIFMIFVILFAAGILFTAFRIYHSAKKVRSKLEKPAKAIGIASTFLTYMLSKGVRKVSKRN